jgi:putative transposase
VVKKAFKPEQIINKLREAEVLLSQGAMVGEASRKLGVTEQTYYRWRREYGGMRVDQAKRLQELEKENTRLKRLVADITAPTPSGTPLTPVTPTSTWIHLREAVILLFIGISLLIALLWVKRPG